MIHYKPLKFNHANLHRPVHIIAGTIAGYHFSEPTKCVVVYTTGGIFPVVETIDQIDEMILKLNSPNGHEVLNERK